MAIAMAKQQGSTVYVYDEHNHVLWTRSGELMGYTGACVTIKSGSTLWMMDEHNHTIGVRSAN